MLNVLLLLFVVLVEILNCGYLLCFILFFDIFLVEMCFCRAVAFAAADAADGLGVNDVVEIVEPPSPM